jgi:UDP-N-acetylmuramoyl-tripeptide--D-alanyl-D-alanine ligase
VLLTYGTFSKSIHEAANVLQKKNFTDKTKLQNELIKIVQPGDIVLVKGSHGMKMNEVVDGLKQSLESVELKSNKNVKKN